MLPDGPPTPASFRLRFGPLEWGWLPTEITFGTFRCDYAVSTCFDCPVNQWVHACHELAYDSLHLSRSGLDSPSCVEIRHHYEPHGHSFTLTEQRPFRPLPKARVSIEVSLRDDIIGREGASAPPLQTWPAMDFALLEVAREVCRAARGVFRRHGFAYYHRHAMREQEFPAGELLRLHEYVYPPAALATFGDEWSVLSAEQIAWEATGQRA